MHLLKAALRYTNAGVAVIPLWPDRRKNPKLTSYSEFYERLPTRGEWARWAQVWPDANIGLITGYWGLVALDFDDFESYQAWDCGLKGQTWTVRTGRGYHVWFRIDCDPGASRNYTKDGGGEVLLRARGGYCIVPPSMHHTGTRYKTVHKVKPLKADIEDILAGWQTMATATSDKTNSPDDLYQTIGQVRIEDLIEPRGKPNARGAYQVPCPFHHDTKPSAWLNVEQQRFGCNACTPGLWLDTVNVYAKMKGISNGEAYKLIGAIKCTGRV